MADILIRGMEMPKTCGECRFCRPKPPYPCNCYAGDFLIKPSETDLRDGLCPLVELPEHGDLIDRSELKTNMIDDTFGYAARYVNLVQILDATVVIPSNKEDADGV